MDRGRGVDQKWTAVDRGEGVKNGKKCVDILYGWPLSLQEKIHVFYVFLAFFGLFDHIMSSKISVT